MIDGRSNDVIAPAGYSPEISYPRGVQLVDGVEDARKAVREQIANGADWIKVYADRSSSYSPTDRSPASPHSPATS